MTRFLMAWAGAAVVLALFAGAFWAADRIVEVLR